MRSLPLLILLGTLILTAPLLFCMPLTADAALYDVQARVLLSGGTLYRDVVEPNLPGAVWIHAALRSVAGWSVPVLRTFDMIVVFGGLMLLGHLTAGARTTSDRSGHSSTLLQSPFWYPAAALLIYASLSEWCHCQRDLWMLLPAAAALMIRNYRRSVSDNTFHRPAPCRRSAFAEGLLWGIAVWLKPHILVSAAACSLMTLLLSRRKWATLRQEFSVVLGGVAAGVPGVVWLIASGTWPHFTEMLLVWNPEYLDTARASHNPERLLAMAQRLSPWVFVHVIAVPLSLRLLGRSFRSAATESDKQQSLAAVLYLSWTAQSLLLQHTLDYIHVVPIFLGLAVVLGELQRGLNSDSLSSAARQLSLRPLLTLFILGAVLTNSRFLRPDMPALWQTCVTRGPSPAVQAQLSLTNFPDRQDVADVVEFLRSKQVTDGDVLSLNAHGIHVLRDLGITPPNRYWCYWMLARIWPSHADEMRQAVSDASPRYIITESNSCRALGVTDRDSLPFGAERSRRVGTFTIYQTLGDQGLVRQSAGSLLPAAPESESPDLSDMSRPAAYPSNEPHFPDDESRLTNWQPEFRFYIGHL